jgi:type VI secretion system protein VasD
MKCAVSTLALVAGIAALARCSSKAPSPKEPAVACSLPNPLLAITASENANASGGQGRPVQVRVYQLKSDARLLSAGFEDVWRNDAAYFAGDLLKVDEYTVYPGQTKLVKIARNPEAQSLAAVALFREPQGKSWFVSYELATPRKDAPCPPAEPRIAVWVDRMQIEDGQGRPTGIESFAAETPAPDGGQQNGAGGPKGN